MYKCKVRIYRSIVKTELFFALVLLAMISIDIWYIIATFVIIDKRSWDNMYLICKSAQDALNRMQISYYPTHISDIDNRRFKSLIINADSRFITSILEYHCPLFVKLTGFNNNLRYIRSFWSSVEYVKVEGEAYTSHFGAWKHLKYLNVDLKTTELYLYDMQDLHTLIIGPHVQSVSICSPVYNLSRCVMCSTTIVNCQYNIYTTIIKN